MNFNFFTGEICPEVTPHFAGHEQCESGHSYAYYNCEYTLIHYCISGKGTVTKNGECHNVSSGQIFIILPGDNASYVADAENPWEYVWVSFDLSESDSLSGLPVVSDIHSDIFIQIKERLADENCTKLFVISKIYELLAELSQNNSPSKIDYPKIVKQYIKLRYADDISVEQIADHLNINRRYMSRIFKGRYGKSVVDYLVDFRLKKASERLLSGESVTDAALSSGYRDVFNFSKMFKRKYGVSPKEFAKNIKEV